MWRYVIGAGLARTADEGARVGLVLLAVERTGSPTLGGMLVAALLVPQVVAASVVGRTVDRARRPARTLGVLAAGFAVCLGLAVVLLGRVSVVLVVLLLLAAGTMAPAVTGGLSSRLGTLVPPERLGRAFGLDSVVYNVCGVAGPAAVAVLAAEGAGLPMAVLATGGVVGSLIVARLPLGPPTRADRADRAQRADRADPPPSAGRSAWAGVTVLVRDRALSAVTVASCLAQVGLGALGVVVALVASRGGSVQTAALVVGALPVGALLGSLAWTWHPAAPGRAPSVVMWSQVALGVPVALAGAARGLGGLAALLLLSGVALGPATGALLLTREHRSPAQLVGQAFGLGAGVKLACGAAGAALAGLAAGLDSWLLLLGCGSLPVTAGVLGAVMLRFAAHREAHSDGPRVSPGRAARGAPAGRRS